MPPASSQSPFSAWFAQLNGGHAPHPWQLELAESDRCENRLLRIPTGFGKTAGTVLAWLWHRVVCKNDHWPRRLVFCLPMRVLAEQVEANVQAWLATLGRLWTPGSNHDGKVGLHLLMGGATPEEWHLHPEADAILIGTQDMLLSRSLNRGYAAARARWPMEFGLLQQDCLWVYDEVQLMDVALSTSAQLQAFRELDREKSLRPCVSWWMSATLQRRWMDSVDARSMVQALPCQQIAPEQRRGWLWDDVEKVCTVQTADGATPLADLAVQAFRTHGRGKLTLVVCNTVDRARDVHAALAKALQDEAPAPETQLVHSRFRPHERTRWRDAFLRRDAEIPAAGRIVVATQVVEAGVDLDAAVLVTELAPWPSLVQRFGRAARGGGRAQVLVVDLGFAEDKQAAPYSVAELQAARAALASLPDVSPRSLEQFEENAAPEQLDALYPYEPLHLLMAHEWRELFDTTPDLTGADLDISRFLRSGDERDVQVFWADIAPDETPTGEMQPRREALCAVPFLAARKWICDKGRRPKEGMRAWIWDWLEGRWTAAVDQQIAPGRVILVASHCGGYDPSRGFDPRSRTAVPTVAAAEPDAFDQADNHQDDEPLSAYPWKTIAWHGQEVSQLVGQIGSRVGLPPRVQHVLQLAAVWHDLGKAHPAFQSSIRHDNRPARCDLAKAPADAWPRSALYRISEENVRRGFRHELASALALFAVLERHRPDHDALRGRHRLVWQALGSTAASSTTTVAPPTAVEAEILDLTADEFDLMAYLVASHHGKVRLALHATPADQDWISPDDRGMPIRGVREGDELPPTELRPGLPPLPGTTLTLEPAALGLSARTGHSWTERMHGMLERHGIARIGFLEALLRAADVRASRLQTDDPAIAPQGGR